jgi:hypothetical protein
VVLSLQCVEALAHALNLVANPAAHPYSTLHELAFLVHTVNFQLIKFLILLLKPVNLTLQLLPLSLHLSHQLKSVVN